MTFCQGAEMMDEARSTMLVDRKDVIKQIVSTHKLPDFDMYCKRMIKIFHVIYTIYYVSAILMSRCF